MNSRKLRKSLFITVPVLLFCMLALCIRAGVTVHFEGWAYSESVEHMSPVLTGIMKGITHLGDPAVVIAVCLLLFAPSKTRRTIALPVSLTVIVSGVLNIVLKSLFKRERPDILRLINETSYSFPSGHAMVNAALYTMLILLIFRFITGRRLRMTLSTVCIVMTLAIGFSRVYLGVHYAGDVLGGWLIGFSVSLLMYTVWDKYLPKFSKKPKI